MSKLIGNGLWQSKFILPEHKSAILERNKNQKKVSKPVLHEDEIEIINNHINKSYHEKELIQIEIFSEWGNRVAYGVVSKVSQYKFKLESSEGFEWFDYDEILSTKLE